MAAPKIPYPPSPTNVPDDLTDYPASYKSKQNMLLIALFMFLLFYFGLVALCVLLGTYCALSLGTWPLVKIAGIVFFSIAFLFLVKGFFKRHPREKDWNVEIAEAEQPVLFGFIHQLCEELNAPVPDRVYVCPDVNAAMIARTSFINLVKEPKRDMLIGLGLVNCMNLSEFKAVIAHELGHFCQSAYSDTYTWVTRQVIRDLVVGEDFLDRFLNWCKAQGGLPAAFGYTFGGLLWLGRKPLELVFKVITLQWLSIRREQEFHADLVAVSAAGSDAIAHGLLRSTFGFLCFNQAAEDLSLASEHQLYSRDLYHHQNKAAPLVRRQKKEPNLGLPPELNDPMAGKELRAFDREEEEVEGDNTPVMYRMHPPNHAREENAKERFVPAAIDHRSPWILFAETADLKERLTYKFYRMAFKVKKTVELAEPEEVQQFIDDEHAETTYDLKYNGIYDGRPIEPGDLGELNQIIRDSPWDEERIDKVFAKLHDDAKGRNEDYQDVRKEKATLENTPGRLSPRMRKKLKKLERELDKLWEWFKSLDRRVYLCHVQMASVVNKEWRDELVERYRFGLEIQKFYIQSQEQSDKAVFYTNMMMEVEHAHPDTIADFMQVLRKAWKTLKNIVQDARDINMPAMKNFEEGERLADFILDKKMVPEPPMHIEDVRVAWVQKLVDQLRDVRRRCGRLHWKSVGGILALQEKIAAAWEQRRLPIEAALIVEPHSLIPGEVLHAEPLDAASAEVLEAAPLLDEEILEAEPIEAEPVEEPLVEPPPPAEPDPVFLLPGEVEPASEILPPPIVVSVEPPIVDAPVLAASQDAADEFTLDLDAKQEAPAFAPTPMRGETIAKPAKNGRPPMKITYVLPGEKSPLESR